MRSKLISFIFALKLTVFSLFLREKLIKYKIMRPEEKAEELVKNHLNYFGKNTQELEDYRAIQSALKTEKIPKIENELKELL